MIFFDIFKVMGIIFVSMPHPFNTISNRLDTNWPLINKTIAFEMFVYHSISSIDIMKWWYHYR